MNWGVFWIYVAILVPVVFFGTLGVQKASEAYKKWNKTRRKPYPWEAPK